MNDIIEFYLDEAMYPFNSVQSSIVPPIGSYISIKKKTYKVEAVSFALDRAGQGDSAMRANVFVSMEKST